MLDMVPGEEEKRFCKVHVGQICSPEGFYLKQSSALVSAVERERWIQFSGENIVGSWKSGGLTSDRTRLYSA